MFLRKLVELEQGGVGVGQPLGKGLTSWRKIIVVNRDWRIVFRLSPDEDVTTVCVIGDREDEACYRQARERAAKSDDPEARSLAESMLSLMGSRKERRQASDGSERADGKLASS